MRTVCRLIGGELVLEFVQREQMQGTRQRGLDHFLRDTAWRRRCPLTRLTKHWHEWRAQEGRLQTVHRRRLCCRRGGEQKVSGLDDVCVVDADATTLRTPATKHHFNPARIERGAAVRGVGEEGDGAQTGRLLPRTVGAISRLLRDSNSSWATTERVVIASDGHRHVVVILVLRAC